MSDSGGHEASDSSGRVHRLTKGAGEAESHTPGHFPVDLPAYVFPEGSVIRRIGREALVLLGGGRAVLLQIAHPLIMAGVARYSQFQADPLARFLRTMVFMDTLVFGDPIEIQRALEGFNRVHDRVQGHLPKSAGRHLGGTPYSGHDPALRLWVFATLVDSSLRAYQRFAGPLRIRERQEYYVQSRLIGRQMDIPDEILPPNLGDFNAYMAEMLASDELAVTEDSRSLAQDVLYPQVGLIPSMSAALMRLATAGMLPERFRRDFGLTWNRRRRWILKALSAFTRTVRPFAPGWIWRGPLRGGKLAVFLLREL